MTSVAVALGANSSIAHRDMKEVMQLEIALANISTIAGTPLIDNFLGQIKRLSFIWYP